MAAYFQIVGGALCKGLADLDLQLFLFSLCGLNQLGGLLVLLDKGQSNVDTHVRTSLQIVGE